MCVCQVTTSHQSLTRENDDLIRDRIQNIWLLTSGLAVWWLENCPLLVKLFILLKHVNICVWVLNIVILDLFISNWLNDWMCVESRYKTWMCHRISETQKILGFKKPLTGLRIIQRVYPHEIRHAARGEDLATLHSYPLNLRSVDISVCEILTNGCVYPQHSQQW